MQEVQSGAREVQQVPSTALPRLAAIKYFHSPGSGTRLAYITGARPNVKAIVRGDLNSSLIYIFPFKLPPDKLWINILYRPNFNTPHIKLSYYRSR
jgi:hypothetical protein